MWGSWCSIFSFLWSGLLCGVRDAQSLVFCEVVCRSLFFIFCFLSFSFDHWSVWPFSIYGFWLLPFAFSIFFYKQYIVSAKDGLLFRCIWVHTRFNTVRVQYLAFLCNVLSNIFLFVSFLLSFGHCIVCLSSYDIRLPLWYLHFALCKAGDVRDSNNYNHNDL